MGWAKCRRSARPFRTMPHQPHEQCRGLRCLGAVARAQVGVSLTASVAVPAVALLKAVGQEELMRRPLGRGQEQGLWPCVAQVEASCDELARAMTRKTALPCLCRQLRSAPWRRRARRRQSRSQSRPSLCDKTPLARRTPPLGEGRQGQSQVLVRAHPQLMRVYLSRKTVDCEFRARVWSCS